MSSQPTITPARCAGIVCQPNPYRGNVAFWNRRDIADALGRAKTRWVINQIELAVSLGYIHKIYSNDGTRDCWVYTTQQSLF